MLGLGSPSGIREKTDIGAKRKSPERGTQMEFYHLFDLNPLLMQQQDRARKVVRFSEACRNNTFRPG